MIDSHCHLDVERFDADRAAVISRAFSAGVEGLVIPAIGPDAWEALLALPTEDARLQVGLGIHPQLLPDLSPEHDASALERLDRLLAAGGAAAVGECGLDGPTLDRTSLVRQLDVLEAHFALARKHRLPVLLHCFHAHPALLDFLEAQPFPEAGVLMHSYSGGAELAKRYLKLGCHFSFAGPVTYLGARKPLAALREIPVERLLVETDSPDQAPHPHRGERSEPAYLPLIVEAMAKTLGLAAEELGARLSRNTRAFFRRPFDRPTVNETRSG